MKPILCLSLILILATTALSYGAIIHVPGDQPTIQAGIDAASDGDTVLVADGTYTGDGNKNLDLNGKAITVKSENGPDNCTIDCDESGRGFYFHNGEGEDSEVSGFTIINGNVSNHGGGFHFNGSSPTITNCNISDNWARNDGGGLYCVNGASPIITNCNINDNGAYYNGGGISCRHSSSPTITNCNIAGNHTVTYNGGGIHCGWYSPAIITSCNISSNSAKGDGGGISCSDSSMTISNCNISNNSAGGDQGGGIYCAGSPPTITNCNIIRVSGT